MMPSSLARRSGLRPTTMCWWAAGLIAPAILFYAASATVVLLRGDIPTPYIHRDMAYYMANAREYLDADTPWIAYGNPFSPDQDTPRIYFQPWTLLLALVWKLTGASPGLIFLCFGVVSAWLCAWFALLLFRDRFGLSSTAQKLTAVCFFWGGGVLSLVGIASATVDGQSLTAAVFRFDPADGFWMLNLGRNIIYPTEAFYHALVLALAVFVHRQWHAWSLGVLAILCMSHPFTGIEFSLIAVAWGVTERIFFRRPDMPSFFLPGVIIIAIAGLSYYFLFLPQFLEHQILMQQWALEWLFPWPSQLLADGPVLLLAVWHYCHRKNLAEALRDPFQRFLGVWFMIVFLLEHHDLFIRPHQPIHFAHGYSWMPLFLLAAPRLILIFERVSPRPVFVVGILLVALSDNLIWLTVNVWHDHAKVTLTPEREELREWLQDNVHTQELLIADDSLMAYLGTVYSPIRAWRSHFANTPNSRLRKAELEAFFGDHQVLPVWQGKTTLVLFDRTRSGAPALEAADRVLLSNRRYILIRRHFADP